jgi:tetratricopeptide (TPR) repeat protein
MIPNIAWKASLTGLAAASLLAVGGEAIASDPRVGVGVGFSNRGSAFAVNIASGHRGFVSPGVGVRRFEGFDHFHHFDHFRGGFHGGTRVFIGGSFYWPAYYPYYSYSYYPYDYSYPVSYAQPVVIQQQPVIVQAPPQVVQQPVEGQALSAQPVQQQATEQQGTYRDRELGDAYMRMNDPANAIRAYLRYLGAWAGDGTAQRNYGFALIAHGDVQDGFRAVVKGYQLEADLAKRSLRKQDFGGDLGFQRVLDAAARGADSTNMPEGWLTVAILQHAAGNHDAAVTALQHARDAGLDQKLLDQFTLEIGKPQ